MARTFIGGVTTPVDDPEPASKVYVDRYCPVTGRATTYAGTDGTSGTGTAVQTFARTGRTLHRVIGTASAIKLEYLNWYTQPNAPGEVDNPNSVTYRASIEYPAGRWRQISGTTTWDAGTAYAALDQVVYSGQSYVALTTTVAGTVPTAALGTQWQQVTRYQVRFTGQDVDRRVAVAGGAQVVSLPIFLATVEGQFMAVTTTVSTASSTNVFSADIVGTAAGEFALNYPSANPTVGTVDLVDKNVTTETTLGAGTRVPMPSAVLGLPASPEVVRAVGLIGDSLNMGYLDAVIDFHQKGYLVRGAEYEDVRYRRIPQGADRLQFWTATNAAKRIALVQGCTSVIVSLGSNDVAQSRTLAQLQADSVACWTALGAKGAKIFQCTITPKTTSTDGWATKANQTPVFAAGGVRDTYNDWLRTGASIVINGSTVTVGMSGHPLTGVIDASPAVEDASDSHYWKSPSWTTDGGHPTALGYDALALKVRPWMAQVVGAQRDAHAALHAVGGPDPITPASIGAADVATLGGYLNALSAGYGGFQDYLLRGEIASSAPSWAPAGSSFVFSATQRTVMVCLGYATNQTLASLEFLVATAAAGGTFAAVANFYTGTGITLSKVGADVTVTTQLQSTGLKTITMPGTMNGYLVATICLTAISPTTFPQIKATSPLDVALMQTPSGTCLSGFSSGATLPSTIALNSGWTVSAMKPWMAARAF
jgi:lysophospholipase L1-like esterase